MLNDPLDDPLWEAAQKHLKVPPGGEIDLAHGLRAWRENHELNDAEDRSPDINGNYLAQGLFAYRVKRRWEMQQNAALRFMKQLEMGLSAKDCSPFLKRLWKASIRERDGCIQPLEIKGLTVLAIQNLRVELGRQPDKHEVKELVERWRKEEWCKEEKLSPVKNWPRIFRDPSIAALFREG